MIEVLQKSMHLLRQVQMKNGLRLQSLETLEEIAHWKLMYCYQQAMEELQRCSMVKAGFKFKQECKDGGADDDPDGDRDDKINSIGGRENDLTSHGGKRAIKREISLDEITKAMKTAKESGQTITKIGPYGTPQIHYIGSNGVTVIVETEGRNAGKVITLYRRKG